jgi:hypothetical protein
MDILITTIKTMFERKKQMNENKPVHTLSYGAIKVSIWENESDLGTFCNVGFHRVYNKDGKWEKSTYFSEYDVPILSKAILDAHSWIQNHKNTDVQPLCLPAVANDDDVPQVEN